jgi:hypothetical protein
VTERRFEQGLLKIPFPPSAAATARALVRAKERRAELAVRQARSSSLAALQSFTRRHQSADAAVQAQVKAIRRALELPGRYPSRDPARLARAANAGIARRLFVTEGTVEKHVSSIFTKLNLHEAGEDHRRVLAAIAFLKAR